MATETERKFLVAGEGWRDQVTACMHILQGYLVVNDDLEIRIRITDGEKASVTIKAADSELSREEFEYSIPVPESLIRKFVMHSNTLRFCA